MEATFKIDGRLIGLNDIIGRANHNRYAGAALKKTELRRVTMWIMAGNVPTFTTPVEISFRWIEKDNRRDIDNIAAGGTKVILDALVELHRLPNDGRKWVKRIEHCFPDPDAKNPRVEVKIKSISAA